MKSAMRAAATIVLVAFASGCAKAEYIGNTSKGFWSDSPVSVPPNSAYQKANAFLDATWETRCKELHKNDEWCDKPPLDHMVRKGDYYYVTRTSYVYKSYDAYTKYAVKVHVDTGDVTPLE